MASDASEGAAPSFPPITAQAGRVGVVDIGSNSVRLVVFDAVCRAPDYFFNEKVACGLGEGIAETGRLSPQGRAQALDTLRRFMALAGRMRLGGLEAVATAAVREAQDGPEFVARVRRETGLAMRVITGDEEARLSAMGVMLGEPMALGGICDMGGASMELAEIGGGAVGGRITLALGPQRLAGLGGKALDKTIDAELARAGGLDLSGRPLWLVGGAWRAFAKLHMARVAHPLHVLSGYRMAPEAAVESARWIAAQSPESLRETADISSGRARTGPMAAQVLARLLERLRPAELALSSSGLREGVFFDRLPPALRARDPLIAASRRLEAAMARFPGFGERLALWLAPALRDFDKRDRRLAHAAALLADVNWRVHPDWRPTSCFETAARANLAGIDHRDRVFLGAALMERYGGGGETDEIAGALGLLDQGDHARAYAIGRGLRLGGMLSGAGEEALADAPLRREGDALTLTLRGGSAVLAGAAVERRLASFAVSLGPGGGSTRSLSARSPARWERAAGRRDRGAARRRARAPSPWRGPAAAPSAAA